MKYISIILSVLCLLLACQKKVSVAEKKERVKPGKAEEVILQPFAGFPKEFSDRLLADMSKIFPRITLNEPIPLPQKVFRNDSSIYKADSLVAFLERKSLGPDVLIGLTDKNIGIGKYRIKEIMGLADKPGYSCVVSTHMLSPKNTYSQLLKLTLHELAHTQGVPHCRVDSTCYMSNANGDNPWDVETGFCSRCKTFLVTYKGWQLN